VTMPVRRCEWGGFDFVVAHLTHSRRSPRATSQAPRQRATQAARGREAPRRARATPARHHSPYTGAGEDHGIGHDQNWLRFPYDSTFLRSHYLHPHPYRPAPAPAHRRRSASSLPRRQAAADRAAGEAAHPGRHHRCLHHVAGAVQLGDRAARCLAAEVPHHFTAGAVDGRPAPAPGLVSHVIEAPWLVNSGHGASLSGMDGRPATAHDQPLPLPQRQDDARSIRRFCGRLSAADEASAKLGVPQQQRGLHAGKRRWARLAGRRGRIRPAGTHRLSHDCRNRWNSSPRST
jgi:hypothetical protein